MKKLFALLLVTIICLGGCSGADKNGSNNGFGNDIINNGNKTIECPDFTGMKVEEIKSEYGDIFDITWGAKYSDTVEKGKICDQSIKPGKELLMGEDITVYISYGKQVLKMPDMYSKEKSFAISELRNFFNNNGNAQIQIEVVTIAHYDVAAGYVIKTEPAAGAEVSINDDIIVYVSTGKPVKMVSIPDVMGKTTEEAKILIEEAGLLVEIIRIDMTDGTPSGQVVGQQPPSGKILEGKTVALYVSK